MQQYQMLFNGFLYRCIPMSYHEAYIDWLVLSQEGLTMAAAQISSER